LTYPFPSLYNDTVFSALFEHQLIPHYVWLLEGTVRAITASHEISEENINRILNENPERLTVKKDIDTQKPLFIDRDVPFDNLQQYSIFLKGRIDGLPSGNRYRKTGSIVHGRAMSNTGLLSMYSIIGRYLIEGFTENRLILEVKDSGNLIFNEKRTGKEEWYKNNLYSYELMVSLKEAGKLYKYMLDDLNKYSGYYGNLTKRETLCLILVRAGDFENKIGKKKNLPYPAIRMSDLMNRLNRLKTTHPVLDETCYYQDINIPLPSVSGDWRSVKKELNKYGLDLIEAKRELEMLVIKDKIQ
jgi:hypothetical protein